jgi:hypothetical protein
MRTAPLLAVAALLGCAAPPPAPPATSGGLPEGCGDDFEGRWVLASDPSWSYRSTDDGGTVVFEVERRWADGGTSATGSSAKVVLRRGPGGLTGETRVPRMGSSGPGCEASLPVELSGCPDGGLLLRTVARMRVDGHCAAVDAAPPERRTYLLVPAPVDGGS